MRQKEYETATMRRAQDTTLPALDDYLIGTLTSSQMTLLVHRLNSKLAKGDTRNDDGNKTGIQIPAQAFGMGLAPAEAIVKHLKKETKLNHP